MNSLSHTHPVSVKQTPAAPVCTSVPTPDPALFLCSRLRSTFRIVEALARNKARCCYASLDYLSRSRRVAPVTIRRHVAELISLSVMRRVSRPGCTDLIFICPAGEWKSMPPCLPNDQGQYMEHPTPLEKKTTRQPRKPAAALECPAVAPQPDSVVVSLANAGIQGEGEPAPVNYSQVETEPVEGDRVHITSELSPVDKIAPGIYCQEIMPSAVVEPLTEEQTQTVRALVEQRVPVKVAADAVRQDAKRAADTLRALLRAQKAAAGVRNPGGWFRAAWTAADRWDLGQADQTAERPQRYRIATTAPMPIVTCPPPDVQNAARDAIQAARRGLKGYAPPC